MIDWDTLVIGPLVSQVFGQAVQPLYAPRSGVAPFAVDGVYDAAFREVTIDGEPGMNTTSPVLGVRLSQFAAPPVQGDQVNLLDLGLTFVVKNVQPDGHGWALLRLQATQ